MRRARRGRARAVKQPKRPWCSPTMRECRVVYDWNHGEIRAVYTPAEEHR